MSSHSNCHSGFRKRREIVGAPSNCRNFNLKNDDSNSELELSHCKQIIASFHHIFS